ncbi:hypothetical protein AMTRI_Chr06g175270 [Amborella trichopoda]
MKSPQFVKKSIIMGEVTKLCDAIMFEGDGGKLEIFRGGRMEGRWHRIERENKGRESGPVQNKGSSSKLPDKELIVRENRNYCQREWMRERMKGIAFRERICQERGCTYNEITQVNRS